MGDGAAHPLECGTACTASTLVPRYPATADVDARLGEPARSVTAICPEASQPLHTPNESTVP